jgi:hypothetical protein
VAFAFAVAVAFAFAFLVFHSRREPAVALAFAVVLLQNHQSVVISTGASRLCLCDAQWRDLQWLLLLLFLCDLRATFAPSAENVVTNP